MIKNQIFLILFGAVGLLNIIGEQAGLKDLVLYTKPLLVPILLVCFYLQAPQSIVKRIVIGALVAAWIGDIALLLHDRGWGDLFLIGIGCFAVTQILFALSFSKISSGKFFQDKLPILLIGVIWIGFNLFINRRIDSYLVIPIAIYALLISMMLLQAWYLYANHKIYAVILFGACLFYLSDLTIAMTKFAGLEFGILKSGTIIMTTYILALLFIVKGLLK